MQQNHNIRRFENIFQTTNSVNLHSLNYLILVW